MMRRFLILLFCITLFGAAFRFYNLGSNPIALNRDEVSIGYNAYSLLQTGKEEHGQSWPINIESFGDWKLPGYIYLTIPSIAVFGLNEWSIRLPAALAGTLLIPATAFLVYQLFPEKKDHGLTKALWASLFIAISPWTIRLSRQTYESTLGLLWLTLASGLLVWGFREPKHQRWTFPLGALLLGTSMLTYHSYQLLVPVLVAGMTIIYWPQLRQSFQKSPWPIVSGITLGLFAVGLLWLGGAQSANTVKLSGISALESDIYRDELFIRRLYFAEPAGILARLYSNTFLLMANRIWGNFLNILSGSFLFIYGGGHGSHDVVQMGNISPVIFFFSLAGLYAATRKISTSSKLIFLLIIASFAAPLITTQAAHSVRLLPLMIPLSITAAWGITHLLGKNIFRFTTNTVITGALLILLSYQTLLNTLTYFVVAPQRDVNNWNWIMKASVRDLTELSQETPIFIPYREHSYATYFLFYNQTHPRELVNLVEYAPIDKEGFRHIRRYGNITFDPMDWDAFVDLSQEQKAFALVKEHDIPSDKQNLPVIREYDYPYAEQRFLLISNGGEE